MITKKEKLFYGFGDMGYNILMSGISFYLLYFMINVGGLKASLASLVFLVSKVWDAVTDYLMGRISDKTKSKFGKRRIYMLLGSLPFMISFALLWVVPNTNSQLLKFLFYLIVYMFYNTCATVVYIPYNSLSANMTNDYNERTSLNSFRIILANLGILLGALLFSLLAEGKESLLYPLFNSEKYAYLLAGVIMGFIAALLMVLCTFNVKEKFDGGDNSYGFFSTLKQFFKLKEFRNTTIFYLLSMTGFDIIMATFMFLVSDTLNFGSGTITMIFIALPLITAMASAFFWSYVSEKKDKIFAYNVASILIFISLLLVLFIPEKSYVFLGIVCLLVGFCMGSIQVMPWACLPDVIEIDEYENHVRREGAFYGIVSFLYKTASGISLAIVSLVLSIFGYVENSTLPQPERALNAIRYMFSFLPGLIFIISIYFAIKSRISKDKFELINKELEERRKK